ncbi:hypothetical protein H6G33_34205 [Calothrix sp. FACHB-1219]|nr:MULTISPECIES: hypothetical protein [unclassified Calothrix]MBD2207426.1 hypothetical protein [Calothrix sp. FACHB-168]MBD2222002.1 hypothetical protein [Calothrix sp. FACHB-1219]
MTQSMYEQSLPSDHQDLSVEQGSDRRFSQQVEFSSLACLDLSNQEINL